MSRTAFATCSLCDAICGVAVEHDGDRVIGVRGDVDDPFSHGHVCPKVIGLKHVHDDPDRVRAPLVRGADGELRETTWEHALDEASARLGRIQRVHGNDAVALYIGNPTAHSYAAVLTMPLLLRALATKNVFSANSMDSHPRQLVSQVLYGSPFLLPIPDIDRADLFVVIGANPAVSNGSIMTAPDVRRRLRNVRERGGRVVVIDPRKSETAALADAHFFVRPGRDAFLIASMLHVLFDEALVAATPAFVDGVDAIRSVTLAFAPERTAERTGVAAADVRALARDFARCSRASMHGRVGVSTQQHAVVTTWLLDVLHILTGNFDRDGGAMFPLPPVDLAPLAKRFGVVGHYARFRSRVRKLPELNGELPIATLADEIETPGPGQIRGLLLNAGNIALSAPNAARIERSLRALDAVVAVDIYVNETTRHAHVILPPTFGLEHDHFPLLFHGVAVRNTAHYSPAVLRVGKNARDDGVILARLAAGIARKRGAHVVAAVVDALSRALPPKRLLALLLRIGPYRSRGITLDALTRAPHGIDLGALAPRLPRALLTPNRRIDIAPALFVAELAGLARELAGRDVDERRADELVLIGRRDLRSNNSWMHNVPNLVRGERRCALLIHPDDAAIRGLVDGARARISSRTGELVVDVHVSDSVMPGVVSLPHGWGHDVDGARLGVANRHPGVNVNALTDDRALDAIAGTVALNGVPVVVQRV